MPNTGNKIYSTLTQYEVVTSIPTGATKPNTIGDPDYVPPVLDSILCPTTTTTTTIAPTPLSCSIVPSSRICCENIDKFEEFSLGTTNGVVSVNYTVPKIYGTGTVTIELLYNGVQQDIATLLLQGASGTLSFNYIYNGTSDLLTIRFNTTSLAASITTIVNCPI